jgi:uncharacterized repeat protein (TIGR01451 family)
MTSLKSLITKKSVRLSIVSAVAAAIVVPIGVQAWGPSRPTFTIENPANYVTFNSITNNPVVGDERNFAVARDASINTDGGWSDNIDIQNGKEYTVRVYVHNNANANLNLQALNTRVTAAVDGDAGTNAALSAYVSADNANPQQVWDDVNFINDKHFRLSYVAGSAEIYNNGFAAGGQGRALSDNIVSAQGTPVGYAQAGDGIVPGCFQYVSYVYFKVRAAEVPEPNFTVEKKVRLNGQTDWNVNAIEAQPGQKVDYQIGYQNTGNSNQDNVIVRDTLPANTTYVQGSTTLKNAIYPNGNGTAVTSNAVVGSGLDIGGYTAGSNAFVRFTTTLPTNDQLEVCGKNTLRNTVSITTDNGTKIDTVDVVVTKTDCGPVQNECKPGVPAGDARCAECVPNQNGEMSDDCIAATLPSTGPAETLAVILAVATLGSVTSFLIKRNRALKATALAEALAQEQTETTERQ